MTSGYVQMSVERLRAAGAASGGSAQGIMRVTLVLPTGIYAVDVKESTNQNC